MRPRWLSLLVVLLSGSVLASPQSDEDALSWSAKEAEAIGKAMTVSGRVGGVFDTRLLKTERSYNYKLASTWLTPDVIRATLRLQQLSGRLTGDQVKRQMADALGEPFLTFIVDIDPREGSGIIPDDWIAVLRLRRNREAVLAEVPGLKMPERRSHAAFQGVVRRNYDYDRLWVAFPMAALTGPLFDGMASEAELVVRIYDKEGRVTWPITPALRASLRRP